MDTTVTSKEPNNPPTLSKKQRKTQTIHSDMATTGQNSLAVVRLTRPQERRGRIRKSKKSNAAKKVPIKQDASTSDSSCSGSRSTNAAAAAAGAGGEDEKVEVENRIIALQKIVPGGESLGVDKLFEETAGYIMELQYQVKALKFLASLVEGADKEKRKLGG